MPDTFRLAPKSQNHKSEGITLRSFLHFETVSEGMSLDTLPFSSFWKLKVTSFDRMKKSVLDSG